ncbi:MAG TPA: MFS transporter [Spirochaetia bacterium]|nr:MFS transporter [Spirochaetia bacterium]
MAGFWLRGRRRPAVVEELPPEFRGLNIRKNFTSLIIDAAGWPLGQSFLSPQTVLPMFIAVLSKSNFTIGLVVAVQSVGQLATQLLASNRVERMPAKKVFVFVVGVLVERVPFLLLALAIFVTPRNDVLLAVFFVCWIVSNIGVGINLPAYIGLFAKLIPPALRGRLTGIGNAVGTLLAVGGAYLTTVLLANSSGNTGFGWVFLIGFIFLTLSVIPFLFVDEPLRPVEGSRPRTIDYLRELPAILKKNRPFANYVILQTTLQFVLASTPFITGYAALKLGASEQSVGVSTGIFMAASTVGSFLFGLIADSGGYRRVLLLGAGLAAVTFGILIFSPSLVVVWVCYFIAGLFMSAVSLGNNMSMEYSSPEKAVTYSTIMFSAGGPIRAIGPLLLGLLADRVSIVAVFVIVSIVSLTALYFGITRVTEPRLVRVPS